MDREKIDPQLAFLQEAAAGATDVDFGEIAEIGRFGLSGERGRPESLRAATAAAEVIVLVQFAGDPAELEAAGLRIRSVAGDVVTGVVPLDRVDDVAAVPGVRRIESSRELFGELDLAVVESRANLVHTGPPGRRGMGVIVGLVDSGIDYTHPSFRRADGTTRILNIWDQALAPQAGEASPAGFGYGVEYSAAHIQTALANPNPFSVVRHRDLDGHGTHVAGIAAGDGSAPGQGRPAFTFIGVAPEADIIVVSSNSNGTEGLGTSANTLDGVNYIFQRAAALGRAAVVNMSLGDNLGPHDGTSLLERGLDNLLGPAGRAFVKSAGNVGSAQHHASGNVATGATGDVTFVQPAGNTTPDQLDFWYEGADTFRASVIDSAGNATGVVNVGSATNFTLAGGNTVRIDHRNNDPFNADKRIFITITRGTAAQIRPGNWRLRLVSVTSPSGGRFDGWIQRNNVFNQRPTFAAPHENNTRTISTPGTALEVITAANYITRGAGVGSLSSSSSRGPTRDNRPAPTVAAPGSGIFSAAAHSGGDPYVSNSGTSMSAPHVAGIIALMFQKNRNRTQAQIKQCLESTARSDAFTGPVPNTAWGGGKVDAQAAVACTPAVLVRSVVVVTCQQSVLRPCVSVPITTCPIQSVANSCQRSVLQPCVSVPTITCGTQSVASPCQSVIGGCPSVATPCPSVTIGCASVIDGCPSTPGGCQPPVGRPPVGQPPVVTPGGLTPGGGFTPGGGGAGGFAGGGFAGGVGGGLPLDDQSMAGPAGTVGGSQGATNTPPGGYYEYDESWFDA